MAELTVTLCVCRISVHKTSLATSYLGHIGRLAKMSVLDTEVDGSNPGSSMLCP